jgi:hypothetical protein
MWVKCFKRKLNGRSAVYLKPITSDFLRSFADLTAQIFATTLNQQLFFKMAGQKPASLITIKCCYVRWRI